jgi:hypothetical protein
VGIVLVIISIGLVILGIKGFTASGIPVTKTFALRGTSGRVAGVVCILGGIV